MKLLLCDQITAELSLFMWYSQIAYQNEQILKFFDSMHSLESDEMIAVWQNDSLTLTFYATFSKSIPNSTTFVK